MLDLQPYATSHRGPSARLCLSLPGFSLWLGTLCGAALLTACHGHHGAEEWPTVRLRVDANASTAIRLTHVAGRFPSRSWTRPPDELELPAGAWRLTRLDAPAGTPDLAVPAFGDLQDGATPSAAVPWSLDIRFEYLPTPGADDEFVTIPGGPFLRGDRLGVGQPDERPARIATLARYELGRHEVTNARYAEFLNAQTSTPGDIARLESWLDLRNRKCRIERNATGKFVSDAPNLPVVTVSHAGATAYCRWRTESGSGRRYRLPTEAEWEKAARGPNSWVYSYGNVYTPNAANQESGTLQAVGQFEASPWGLYDLTGNAFEWTASSEEPLNREVAEGPEPRCYLRGGSFVLDGIFLRNSFRMLLRPTVRADDVGFRVLREIPR